MTRLVVHSRIAAAVSAALGATAPTAALRAQDAAASPALEVIIVTATRREANVQDIPFNISALGPEALERQRLTQLAEFTRVVPGLYMADQGPRASNLMTVRGLNVSSLTAVESAPAVAPPPPPSPRRSRKRTKTLRPSGIACRRRTT